MRCPCCKADNDRVIDSRTNVEGDTIRRRRECLMCSARFTTYERIERNLPRVVKRDGRREAFDRSKIERGLLSACQKRPIPSDDVKRLIDDLISDLERLNEAEVPAERIGTMIMERLRALDTVAYVRFASVYSAFDDVRQFIGVVEAIHPSKPSNRRRRPHTP